MSITPRLQHVAALLLALACAIAPVAARACSCNDPPSLADEFAASVAVFTGIVRATPVEGPTFPGMIRVSFDVTAIWKGAVGAEFTVLTPENDGVCRVPFDAGREWLVFAKPYSAIPEAPPAVILCGRTGPAAGNPDVAALGPPVVTAAVPATWGSLKSLYHR